MVGLLENIMRTFRIRKQPPVRKIIIIPSDEQMQQEIADIIKNTFDANVEDSQKNQFIEKISPLLREYIKGIVKPK